MPKRNPAECLPSEEREVFVEIFTGSRLPDRRNRRIQHPRDRAEGGGRASWPEEASEDDVFPPWKKSLEEKTKNTKKRANDRGRKRKEMMEQRSTPSLHHRSDSSMLINVSGLTRVYPCLNYSRASTREREGLTQRRREGGLECKGGKEERGTIWREQVLGSQESLAQRKKNTRPSLA